jgi:hypothetical protein
MTYSLLAAVACHTVFNILSVHVKSFSPIIIVLKLNLSPSIFSPGRIVNMNINAKCRRKL